jgi:hypothetical protein
LVARGFLLLAALALLGLVPAPARDAMVSAAAVRIDRACAADVDRALRGEPRTFARIYGARTDSDWHPLSAAVKRRIARDPDIYSEVAKAWRVDDKVVLVVISSRSLELRAEATYCFRRSGTLARVEESSSGAEVRDDEARYFDERGGLVARRSKFYPYSPQVVATVSPVFKPSTPTLYLTVRALPFLKYLLD